MLSLKKYLDKENDDLTSYLLRIVILLLEATSLHAVEHDSEEYDEFRRQIRATIEKFEQTTQSRDTLIIAGEAVKSLQIYNKSVEKFIRNLSAEKQSIISAMTEYFLKLAGATDLAAQNLRQVEKELGQACQLHDVRLLKSKMQDCLDAICQEAAHEEERAREFKTPVIDFVNSLGAHDQVTGLPGLLHAEARIKALAHANRPAYILALFLRNLEIVNRRVGFAAGDRILALAGQRVGRSLSGGDQLFRWRGPCFVVVMERSEARSEVVAEAGKIAAVALEEEIQSNGRSLFFKASMAWTLIGIRDTPQVSEITRKIDDFAARHNQPKPEGSSK
jgi:GGDEF domain-containing protein